MVRFDPTFGERQEREGGNANGRPLFPAFLNVVLHKFFGVLLKNIVDFIDELINVFLDLFSGLDDLWIRLDLFLGLWFPLDVLLALLFFHPSTSHRSWETLVDQRDVIPEVTLLQPI